MQQVKTGGMEFGPNPDFDAIFRATLDWWGDAGIDNTFVDEPTSWLPPPEEDSVPSSQSGSRLRPPPKTTEEVAAAAPPRPLPDSLEVFQQWWMNSPELDDGAVSGRIPPRGTASPSIMIIAAMPESSDREQLLSGPEGAMIEMTLALTQVDEATVYRASALPCHSPGADWSTANNARTIEVLKHHIGLVKPKRLLIVGFNVLPFLGHDSPQGPAVLSNFNHEGSTIPMLAVRRFPAMASQPRWKKVLWQAWLDWTA